MTAEYIGITICPPARLKGHHGRRGGKNLRARGWEECCDRLSFGHGMVTALMSSQRLWLHTCVRPAQGQQQDHYIPSGSTNGTQWVSKKRSMGGRRGCLVGVWEGRGLRYIVTHV